MQRSTGAKAVVYMNQCVLESDTSRETYIGEPEYREERYTHNIMRYPDGGEDFILRGYINDSL